MALRVTVLLGAADGQFDDVLETDQIEQVDEGVLGAGLCFIGQIFATPHSPRLFIGLNVLGTMALSHKLHQEKVF